MTLFFFSFIFYFITSILRGFVISYLWEWFVVGAFSLESITILQATGIYIISQAFLVKRSYQNPEKSNEESMTESFAFSIGGSIILFVIGWILSLFV